MAHIRQFDHIGITVADLDSVTAFFAGLGLEVEGRTFVEGEFIDTVIGIPNSRTEIVMLRPPDGGTGIELARFVTPEHEPGSPTAMANELGLRSVCFEVDDLQAAVDGLAANGYGLVGGIGQHENTWREAFACANSRSAWMQHRRASHGPSEWSGKPKRLATRTSVSADSRPPPEPRRSSRHLFRWRLRCLPRNRRDSASPRS